MTESPVPTPVAHAAPAPAAARPGVPRRLLRGFTAPLRYAVRRPRRAALLSAGSLALLAGAAVVAGLVWFDSHLRAARAEADRWHIAEAIRHLSACRTLRPDHPDVLLLGARLARRTGEEEFAAGLLERYAAVHGEDDRWAFERLLDSAARGELETSTPALMSRIREGGADARPAREALVLGLSSRLQWAEARAVLEQWLREQPDDPVALLLLAKITEHDRSIELAIPAYERVLQADPEQLEARLRLAVLRIDQRRADEALAHLTVLRSKLPEHPEVQVLWVRALDLLGRTAEARSALDACLAAHPNYAAALVERGGFALLQGDSAGAEEFLARAVRLDPTNPAARNQYALALARNGKHDEANREYAAIREMKADGERIQSLVNGPLRTNPNDPAVHHEIAVIALRSGQLKEALRWFNSALKVDPNYAPTHRTLAALYRDLGDPILAAKHRALAQRGGPPTP